MNSLNTMLNNNPSLPSPPAIALKVLDAVKKDTCSFGDLALIIGSDPALTAKILRVANSTFYSLPAKVTTIDKAVSILGVTLVKNLALSFVISKELKGLDEGSFNFDLFWKRAITAAVGAELVSAIIGRRNDDAFVSALLQDIGMIIMYLSRPDDYLKVLDEKRASGIPLREVEQKIFGFDHQELGSELLKLWGLPEEIYLPIRYHHTSCEAPEPFRTQAAVLGLSNRIAGVYHGMQSIGMLKGVKEWLKEHYRIEEMKTDAMIDEVAQRSLKIFSSFEIEAGDMKPFSQILQEANQELSLLNISYEHLVMQYKQAKDEAERLAHELKDANTRLREQSTKDGLTGLYNHRHFQNVMDEELEKASRNGRPLSLVMFDFDHFKKINDSFGHPQGDEVLKAVKPVVEKLIRACDYAVRYGGEEFALVLPETGLHGAAAVAEALRSNVEQMTITANDHKIRVTISIGVACCRSRSGQISKAQLVEAADKALYDSKRNGRNRITIAADL